MIQIEATLIGLLLKQPDALDGALRGGVRDADFLDPTCAAAWRAVVDIDAEGKRPSLGALTQRLGAELGVAVAKMIAPILAGLPVEPVARQVAIAGWARRAHEALANVSHRLLTVNEQTQIDEVKNAAADALDCVMQGAESANQPRLMRDAAPKWIDDLERRVTGKFTANVTTGFETLDVLFNGGWHRGAFVCLGARPGVGKSTFALSAAINAATAGHVTMFATLEMTASDITTKVVSNLANVRGGRFVRGDLDDDEMDRTMGAINRIGGMPLWIDDAWAGSFDRFAMHCRRMKRRHNLELVFLDYIGLARMRGRFDSRREEINRMSAALKQLAVELDIAVVALAQLNREAEKQMRGDDPQPGKEHLAESDALGRDPDAVLLIYRAPRRDDKGKPTGGFDMRLHVAKNRWGLERDIPIEADLAVSRFTNAKMNTDGLRT